MKKISAFMALALACAFLTFSAFAQSVTPNAGLQVPAYQQQNWQVPLIFDLNRIDNIFGGTVAVPSIQLSGPITNANQAATKAYVDATAQGFLQASGATMTGPLVLAADPTQPLQAATKEYVDSHAGSGGSMVFPNPGIPTSTGSAWGTSVAAPTGAIVGTTDVQTIINKTIDGISPSIMGYLSNVTSDIQGQLNLLAPLASPALTGTPTAPTASLSVNNGQIATTSFVQSLVSQATASFLPLSGGSLANGAALTLGDGSPAASQAYVATAISGLSGGTGGSGTTQQYLYNAITTASSSGWNKICWIGSSQCSGGVGSLAPAATPTESFGLNSPSASTGTPNAVAHYQLQSKTPGGYTQALYVHDASGSSANAALYYTRDFYVKMPSMPAGKVNIEFDYWPVISGELYMFGTQCAGADGYNMEIDNEGHGWVHSTLSCSQLIDGNYHHIHLTYHRDPTSSTACSGAPCEYWDTVAIDGVTYNWADYLNGGVATLPATSSTWGDGTGSQWQLDVDPTTASSSSPAIYDLYVDTDTVTASATVASSGSGSESVTETTGNLGEFDFDGSTALAGLTCTGSPTVDSNTVYTSANSLNIDAISQYCVAKLSASSSTVYARAEIYVNTQGTGNARVFEFDTGSTGSTQLANVFLQGSNGVVTVSDSANATSYSCGSYVLPTGGWHRFEMAFTQSPTNGGWTIYVDGTQECTQTGLNTGASSVTYARMGDGSSSTTAWNYNLDNVGFSSTGLLGAVTVTNVSNAPLYDLYGSAAAVAQSSLQDSNNLSDLTSPSLALANLLANPGTGSYVVTCASGASCSPVAVLHGAGTAIASASTISPEAEITHVTGTAAISTITLPYTGYSGCIRLIADAAWSTALGGNIANSLTASPGTMYSACADANGTWYVR